MILLFLALVGLFLGTWTYKIETPANRPDEYMSGYNADAGQWWSTGTIKVDDDWMLDPEIPLNYIPVPGEDELYMVIGNDGKIIGYRKRERQIDNSWVWKDVNPDIPEGYEPVEGLEDVYRVTYPDGTVKYLKYIRNEDDTFAFVEVDANGNPINKNTDATTIDGKHVLISGNIYSELNDFGVVIGYDQRIDNGDGTFSWLPVSLPELPDMGEFSSQVQLQQGTLTVPQNGDTSLLDSMASQMAQYNAEAQQGGTDVYNFDVNVTNPQVGGIGGIADITPQDPTVVDNGDGTHTEIETYKETKRIDGYIKTYETYVRKTYDDEGNLLSTYSDGPYETSTKQELTKETDPPQADRSMKAGTLEAEFARIGGSYTYLSSLEEEVFTLLNAQRVQGGLSALTISDNASLIAKLRAADMAGYDISATDLPTYGTLGMMASEYGVVSPQPGENMWKSVPRTADEIHTRFQAVEDARKTRMGEYITQYGIGIVEKDGNYYICEVVL